jgi:hypothetical protein
LRSGVVETIVGGDLPDVFATGRMDDPRARGPITILPQGPPDASFVPNTCDRLKGGQGSCSVQRVGDVRSSTGATKTLDGDDAFTDGEDRTRYTVPYKINTQYWTQSGGADRGDWGSTAISAMPRAIATQNGYVTAWGCRGHYFAGAQRAEEANVKRRYGTACP